VSFWISPLLYSADGKLLVAIIGKGYPPNEIIMKEKIFLIVHLWPNYGQQTYII
jgi:hypothetical protein